MCMLSPANAARLLERDGREASPARVKDLKAIIARGDWKYDGNPIMVASDGTVFRGLTRLSAIAEAGTSVGVLLIQMTQPPGRVTIWGREA
jgi:hypothetical protein